MLVKAAHALRETRQEGVPVDASWPQFIHDLTPETQLVLRACAVLDHASLSQLAAAAVLQVPLSQADGALAELTAANWGEIVDDRLDIAPDSWPLLQRLARQISQDDARMMIERIAAAVENAMVGTAPLSTGARGDLLGVLHAANLYELPQITMRVARAAWEALAPRRADSNVAGPGIDLGWWRGVAGAGEQAASRTRQPRVLAELLDASARLYLVAGDWQAAEAAWIRALFVMNKLGDRDEYDRYLELLATTYHDAGQATAFATALEELIERYERDDKPSMAASALARLGATLLGTGQLVSALRYLGQADRLLADLPETTDLSIRRAGILSDMGQAHARREAVNSARTCYHQALTLLVDVDQAAAQRVRDLQALLPE